MPAVLPPPSLTLRPTQGLAVATLYALLGTVGLTLAIPPGYASPIFPAAGLALAAALRLLLLDLRAPHFDEGVNGWFADQMRETGTFRYNPENFHGPWHFYTVFLSQELLGRNLWALRWPAVLASVLTVPAGTAGGSSSSALPSGP